MLMWEVLDGLGVLLKNKRGHEVCGGGMELWVDNGTSHTSSIAWADGISGHQLLLTPLARIGTEYQNLITQVNLAA